MKRWISWRKIHTGVCGYNDVGLRGFKEEKTTNVGIALITPYVAYVGNTGREPVLVIAVSEAAGFAL